MKKLHPKTVTVWIVTCACACILMGAAWRITRLYPDVSREMHTTPSPTPVYGNVNQVTQDPSQATPFPVLSVGSSGERVREIQDRLFALHYPVGSVDGQFGNGTLQAVLAFQENNGLYVDGIVGENTYRALMDTQAKEYMASTPTPMPSPTETATATPAVETAAVKRRMYVTEDGFPLLVNREHPLADNYETYELVVMNDVCPREIVKIKYDNTLAEKEAVDALLVMLKAASAEGIENWQISAAYRTVAEQERLFNKQVKAYMNENNLSLAKAQSATRKTVADPGSSEHHLGTCFDITVPGKTFAGTKQSEWLQQHCWDYGFILRYTSEKENITGFLAEAWHYRYVGYEHAKIMQAENLCLEEYLSVYAQDTLAEDF
ncbi:MAG: D-alanyl-D-alanine carboxypeptidase family protein [Clostridia bacterium]|nr:D-alanyl-D-alanine carboxypeptidase family protein [Clostridia bacterium]